jgi:hypothetical protein
MFHIQSKVKEISSTQHLLESKKKELVDSNKIIKTEIIQIFEDLRTKLNKKEKEVVEKCDMFLQEHLQELNTYTRILQSKIIAMNKLTDSINSNLIRRDEVNLLNFYSDNKNKIISDTEIELPNIPDIDTLKQLKVTINQNSFENLINAVNSMHMEIVSMKGVEVTKAEGNKRFATRRNLYGSKDLMNNSSIGNYGYNSVLTHNNSNEFSRNNLLV